MLTFMSITLLRNVIHSHSSRQAGYVLSQGYVSLVVTRQPSVRPRHVHPLLRPVRLEYRHLLEAHRRLVPLESDSSDDDCVGHHHAASSPRTIVAAPAYASSLYHDNSCLSPRHVHLVSKVSGRPLGDVYQTLSFDAAYFHIVSISEIKDKLGWCTLQQRRYVNRLCFFFKSVNNLHGHSLPPYVTRQKRASKNHHTYSYHTLRARTDAYLHSFLPRTIRVWNMLPQEIVLAPSPESFRAQLANKLRSNQITLATSSMTIAPRRGILIHTF